MATEINKLRIERLVWILVYGGLIALVLGMFVQRYDRLLADIMQIVGTIVASSGALLIWVRSRMK
ncbi:hypothetical protein [Rhodoferax sp. BAB1]|uniref:hypothetical protein n=1 Tax=Rhodoferax sp. BAB1 TaxID=2741720 RepID=UPI0015773408|nr:hypothetical protein [Rhodoferax sp. BAB1]QKO21731.1 hypothetical protein HTY51_07420 [Rhodoferax sp. BAB1]